MRVPFADVGPLKVPDSLSDEQVLFLSDIFPTGYMAAGELPESSRATIAIVGAAGRWDSSRSECVPARRRTRHHAIDRFPERLHLASRAGRGRDPQLRANVDVLRGLRQMTGSQRGPDAHRHGRPSKRMVRTLDAWYDLAKTSMFLATDRTRVAAGD